MRVNISKYIEDQLNQERQERLARTLHEPHGGLRQIASYTALKLKELYWTLTKLVGLGYLHDGKPNIRVWSRALRKFMNAHPQGAVPPPGERFFIEVTELLRSKKVTGIQRVALEVCRAAMRQDGVPVFLHDNRAWACLEQGKPPQPVDIARGDKLVVAGAWWAAPAQTAAVIEEFSQKGGSTVTVLFDLFPLLYYEICSNVDDFVAWFDKIVLASDAVVCISRSVADEFIEIMATQQRPFRKGLRLGWQGLGADFSGGGAESPSQDVLALSDGTSPLLLSVSTLEPRKGYPIALDALDKLWREGVEVRYVIVGREGWMVSALKRRIVSHPEYGQRLFWLSNASDADLRYLYRTAHSLVFASIAEGFGLALAEAAYYGLPAIVSDIPVFREIAGNSVRYFDLADSEMLALRIREALAAPKTPPAIAVTSWQEATETLLAMIDASAYQYGELQERISMLKAENSSG